LRPEIGKAAAWVLGVLAIAGFGPWLVRELRTLPAPAVLAARSSERIVTLEIGGMTCAGCAAKVRTALTEVPGVSMAEVRWRQERAYVVCERALADSVLTRAVQGAGPGFLGVVVAK
jgi:copper chaperone CopZ